MALNIDEILQQGKIPIKTFNLNMLQLYSTILIIAKRNSGKSCIVRAIQDHFSKIPIHVVISPTDLNNNEFSAFMPESCVYHEYKSKIIQKLFMRQKKIIEKAKLNSHIDVSAILIMNDTAADAKLWKHDPVLTSILLNGRHSKITYILTLQDPMVIPPALRNNFDYVFLLYDESFNNLKRIHNAYTACFPSFESFRTVFNSLTENYGCMVIVKNQIGNTDLFNKVFYYKAPLLKAENMRVGCKQMYEFDRVNKNPDWKNRHDIDIQDILLDKKQKLNVEYIGKK
jgi:hypothetical protein